MSDAETPTPSLRRGPPGMLDPTAEPLPLGEKRQM